MNVKPIVTCKLNSYMKTINLIRNLKNSDIMLTFADAGDVPLFKSIESRIEQAIPTDTIEWKRSYGRMTVKNIKLDCTFKSFESCKTQIENYKSENFSILDPVLHVFCAECNVSVLQMRMKVTSFSNDLFLYRILKLTKVV
jgi:hypothetical protein